MRFLLSLRPIGLGLVISVVTATPSVAQQGERVGKAVAEMERLDALRSSLAATFAQAGTPADQEAFGRVCKPVGMAMQQGAKENGWTARQVAIKYRNPANAADAEAGRALHLFRQDPALRAITLRTKLDGKSGTRYLRRITVEPSCLLCHGKKAGRPEFIAKNYPADRAHGFRVGDLRGAYSVFVADVP
jgi:hypothetical protein